MQRQLDESIKVPTMSMDISIDEDSWNSSSQHNDRSSSTLNLTYERGESQEGRSVEDVDDEEGKGSEERSEERGVEEQQEEEEEEDTRRSPTRQRFKDEEEEASDCEEEEENEEQPAAEYQEEETLKEDEGIMLCMPVAAQVGLLLVLSNYDTLCT